MHGTLYKIQLGFILPKIQKVESGQVFSVEISIQSSSKLSSIPITRDNVPL